MCCLRALSFYVPGIGERQLIEPEASSSQTMLRHKVFSWQIPYHPCMVYLPSPLIFIANVSKYTIHGCYGNYSSHQSDNMEKPKKCEAKHICQCFLFPLGVASEGS